MFPLKGRMKRSMAMNSLDRQYSTTEIPYIITNRNQNRPGAFVISFGLPIICYLMAFVCNDISGCPAPSLLHPTQFSLERLKEEAGWPAEGIWGLADFKTTGWVLAYYLLSLTLQRVLPGEIVEGTELRSGGKHKYKFNSKLILLSATRFLC
jgi:hypothetical protein